MALQVKNLDDMTWGRFFDLFFSLENKRESENHLFWKGTSSSKPPCWGSVLLFEAYTTSDLFRFVGCSCLHFGPHGVYESLLKCNDSKHQANLRLGSTIRSIKHQDEESPAYSWDIPNKWCQVGFFADDSWSWWNRNRIYMKHYLLFP